MFNRIRKTEHKSRQAFTLVELIVVLVILAVIAAITVPALTGYIKKAKKSQYIQEVDCFRTAAQAVMLECYGFDGDNIPKGQNVYWDNVAGVSEEDKKWGDKVLQLMGYGRGKENHEPYILVIGVGAPKSTSLSSGQKCTVYYVGYVAEKNSPAVFYVNGEYIYTYPTEKPQYIKSTKIKDPNTEIVSVTNTIIQPEGTNIEITYFVISNRTGKANEGNSSFWTDFKNRAEKTK